MFAAHLKRIFVMPFFAFLGVIGIYSLWRVAISLASTRSRRRIALRFAAAAVAIIALWHSSPVLLWHLRLEDQLGSHGNAERQHSPLERTSAGGGIGWTEIVSGEISLRAPVMVEERGQCSECAIKCRLPLVDGGILAIFDAPPPESYAEALDGFAPDSDDITWLRSVPANWRTIDALTDRVRVRPPPPPSFRYLAEGSRGVVTEFVVAGPPRYVIYAYGDDERPARVIGLTGVSRVRLRTILGELRVEPERLGRASSCSS